MTPINYYLHGAIITRYGCASLNHGERRGNVSPLQKAFWSKHVNSETEVHSTVNADAIRWALRYFLQQFDYPCNRQWDPEHFLNRWENENFDPIQYADDDIFGFANFDSITEQGENQSSKQKNKNQSTKKPSSRKGPLQVTRAISLIPYPGTITFNAKSGRDKDKKSLHFMEYHNTRYQYNFSINARDLKDPSRIFAVIDAIMDVPQVGGHGNVFAYDFSPHSFVFRWTKQFCPHIYYCFEPESSLSDQVVLSQDVVDEIELNNHSSEFWIGGPIAKNLELSGQAQIISSRDQCLSQLKQVIAQDLEIAVPQS